MNDSELKAQLDKVLNDLSQVNGVNGSLIVDGGGEVLSHHILQDADIELFGPMAHVITSSSKRLINYANQGEIERVLVESKYGKALFLHLGNVHFIVVMKNKANVGMVMISSKKASSKIMALTQDLSPIQLEEAVKSPAQLEEPSAETEALEELEESSSEIEETPQIAQGATENHPEELADESTELSSVESEELLTKEISAETSSRVVESQNIIETPIESEEELFKEEIEAPGESSTEEEPEAEASKESPEKQSETGIPVIKPPIAFPKLEKVVETPEDEIERADLILKIYESMFRAMSIGASKIMGVAPARGLTRKFLPVEECKKLLEGVDVKSNSTIDFDKIRENAEKIPISEREKSFKDNFAQIINIITENYGKVMGYAAFRAMVRPEFKIINESYGLVINDLGIKERIHPELLDLFN